MRKFIDRPSDFDPGRRLHSPVDLCLYIRLMSKSPYERARLLILLAAFLSFLISVGVFFLDDKINGIFIGIWVPSILALGSLIIPPRNGPRR